MATLSFEIGKQKQDGTMKVSILLSHKGKRKRLPSGIILESGEISRNGKITSKRIAKEVDDKVKEYRDRLYELDLDLIGDVDIEWIYDRLLKKNKGIDFFEFTRSWIERTQSKSKNNYLTMLNNIRRYIGTDKLLFTSIDYHFLDGFKNFLRGKPKAQHMYLGEIRHMFNEARMEYNNEYQKVIPNSPFEYFKIPRYTSDTNDRVISIENFIKVYNFEGTRRIGLARDCFILSFFLIGTNSVDLYECKDFKNGILSYDRAKTRDRRRDHAHIEIEVPDIIIPLMKKYKGNSRVFDFYTRYTNASNFNKHINKGLKIIAKKLNIPDFDFYTARHTWASIARNKLGIDKYTIHEALNHTSTLDITDVYIQRDYTNINNANKKVVEYIMEIIKQQ